jgi:hypothetical protein
MFLDPGYEIRDPRSGMGKNQDPGSATLVPARVGAKIFAKIT